MDLETESKIIKMLNAYILDDSMDETARVALKLKTWDLMKDEARKWYFTKAWGKSINFPIEFKEIYKQVFITDIKEDYKDEDWKDEDKTDQLQRAYEYALKRWKPPKKLHVWTHFSMYFQYYILNICDEYFDLDKKREVIIHKNPDDTEAEPETIPVEFVDIDDPGLNHIFLPDENPEARRIVEDFMEKSAVVIGNQGSPTAQFFVANSAISNLVDEYTLPSGVTFESGITPGASLFFGYSQHRKGKMKTITYEQVKKRFPGKDFNELLETINLRQRREKHKK